MNINLAPSLYWENEDVQISTGRKIHSRKIEDGELTPNTITFVARDLGQITDIKVTDEYLAFTSYTFPRNSLYVERFKQLSETPHVQRCKFFEPPEGRWSPIVGLRTLASLFKADAHFQMRIYYNGVVIFLVESAKPGACVVFEATTPSGNQTYGYQAITVKTEEELSDWLKNSPHCINYSHSSFSMQCFNRFSERYYFSGEIISQHHRQIGFSTINRNARIIPYDIIKQIDEVIKKNEELKAKNEKYRTSIDSITNLLHMLHTSTRTAKNTKTKEALINEVYNAYGADKDQLKITKHYKEGTQEGDYTFAIQRWKRIGDYICLLTSPRYSNEIDLLCYDTKKNTKIAATKRIGGTEWSFPIPSRNYIMSTFEDSRSITNLPDYRSPLKVITGSLTKIEDGITVRDLFKGTIIDWLLDNYPDFKLNSGYVLAPGTQVTSEETWQKSRYLTLGGQITEQQIHNCVIDIFTLPDKLVFEQLCKSRLFNLAASFLSTKSKGSPVYCSSQDKYRYYERITYDSKKKNLKQMFNLTMNQLRIIDKRLEVSLEEEQEEASGLRYVYRTIPLRDPPSIKRMSAFIQVPLTDLSDKIFEQLLDSWESSKALTNSISPSSRLCECINRQSPKDVLNFIIRYKDVSEPTFVDYLRLRKNLLEYSAEHPEYHFDFSEATLPLRPESARRFIRYEPGPYGTRSEVNFKQSLDYKYPAASSRKDIELIKGEDTGVLLGGVINMTPSENVLYLHDELSKLYSVIENQANQEQFAKATEKIKHLEWADKETGLMVIAPENIADLQKEGAALHHCVGSYVSSVVSGADYIMFIRRCDMPDIPYFTVEIMPDGNIRQVHCYANGGLGEASQTQAYRMSGGMPCYNKVFDVFGFLKHWSKKFSKDIKDETIKLNYAALCCPR